MATLTTSIKRNDGDDEVSSSADERERVDLILLIVELPVMPKKMVKKMYQNLEAEVTIAQAGFHRRRSTPDHIFNVHSFVQKCLEFYQSFFTCFVG